MVKKGKIGFAGPFADVNFGDYAMVVNNIYDLNIGSMALFTYNSDFTRLIAGRYLAGYKVKLVEVQFRGTFDVSMEYKHGIITPIDLLHNISNYDELTSEISKLDVLMVSGGGYFNSLWMMPHRIEKLFKIMAPILIANQLNKKIVFAGNGYGPFINDKDADQIGCMLGVLKNAVFGSRDELYSPMWAKKAGIDKLVFLPDDLLIANKKLGATACQCRAGKGKYMVMETYLPLEYLKTHINSIKRHLDDIYRRHGLSVLFMPFNLGDGGMNQALYLDTQLNHFKYYDIDPIGYLPVQDAMALIKNAALVVCSRYHALVVALAVGTPVVSVLRDVLGDKRYSYNKNHGVLRQLLRGVSYDERCYMRLDYIDALQYISADYENIIKKQNDDRSISYQGNISRLSADRCNFMRNHVKINT